jgi:hypothetical protein
MGLEHITDASGNNALIKRQFVITVDADKTISKDETGSAFLLSDATGHDITLPAVEKDLVYEFIIGSAFATDNWVVASAEGDNISGVIADLGSTVAGVIAAEEDQINFVASAETIGDTVKLIGTDSGWIVSGHCGANGGITATDPA